VCLFAPLTQTILGSAVAHWGEWSSRNHKVPGSIPTLPIVACQNVLEHPVASRALHYKDGLNAENFPVGTNNNAHFFLSFLMKISKLKKKNHARYRYMKM